MPTGSTSSLNDSAVSDNNQPAGSFLHILYWNYQVHFRSLFIHFCHRKASCLQTFVGLNFTTAENLLTLKHRKSMLTYKSFMLAVPGVHVAGLVRADLEARWFDWRHQVRTSGDVQTDQMQVAGPNSRYGRKYNPTALRTGKRVFADLPIQDFSQYSFIDYGSGKGRMLFLAAEYPFRRVLGLEYASDLHALAERNIRNYRNPRQQCFQIESLNVDATEFDPPAENTVAYFFSPFNRPLMEPMIHRLDQSVEAHPRDFFIVYLNPELSEIIDNTRHFKIVSKTPYYNVYRSY